MHLSAPKPSEAEVYNLCGGPTQWQAQCWRWKQREITVLVLVKLRFYEPKKKPFFLLIDWLKTRLRVVNKKVSLTFDKSTKQGCFK